MAAPRHLKPITYKMKGARVIKPIRYVGQYGDYMAGTIDGEYVEKDGRPIPYKLIISKPVN